jgi:lipopolysaccharide transport system permease protein
MAPHSAGSEGVPIFRIAPSGKWVSLRLPELWEFRELLYFLIWRDVKVRYKQTALGAVWAILQPLLAMIIFSLFFGQLTKMPSDGVPYPIFVYTGMLPWTFFANGFNGAAGSLIGNSGLITKIYFPRLALPIAKVLSGLVDFVLAFMVLIVLMAHYGISASAAALWLPVFLLLAMATSLGFGLWFSAFYVKYRDINYILPVMTQLWLFATPIAYPSSLLPEPWHTLYGLNPMAGVVEGFRWALLGTKVHPGPMVAVSVAVTLGLLVGGAYYFRHMEKTFADIV